MQGRLGAAGADAGKMNFVFRSAMNRATDPLRQRVRQHRWRRAVEQRLLAPRPDHPPEIITDFSGPVFVLAPHMDDEVIGCGGTILRHRASGAAVTVLFLTDGSRGSRGSGYDASLPATRKEESRRAAEVLGGLELHFLDIPDRELTADAATIERVAAHLLAVNPAIVYLPTLFDAHPDHRAACRATSAAVARLNGPVVCREYEVWSPLLPNRVVDITDVMETKLAALRCHASQLRDLDYEAVTRGLGMYRSIHRMDGRGMCEAFCEFTPQAHRRLLQETEGRWP